MWEGILWSHYFLGYTLQLCYCVCRDYDKRSINRRPQCHLHYPCATYMFGWLIAQHWTSITIKISSYLIIAEILFDVGIFIFIIDGLFTNIKKYLYKLQPLFNSIFDWLGMVKLSSFQNCQYFVGISYLSKYLNQISGHVISNLMTCDFFI